MSKTFFIADTHFWHSNVIKYENRPFMSAEEMNAKLISNWNKVVRSPDRVFMLGDFALANRQKIAEIVPKLNGHKILIMGNHDQYAPKFYLEAGFDEVSKYPIILDGFWILSHEPMYLNENMPYANIFGHVHGNMAFADFSPQSICVSVERKHMNYTPIEFNQVKKIMGVDAKK